MGKIFHIIGRSSSGKDTIYKRLLEHYSGRLEPVVMYTTRPMRVGERDGIDYFFVDEKGYGEIKASGRIIEERSYDTVHGLWRYFTADDEALSGLRDGKNYLMVGTLASYNSMKAYFGEETVSPLYIELDDGERLARALARERSQERPRYEEMCRRFLADSKDFSEENIRGAGIGKRFVNDDLEICIKECVEEIDRQVGGWT